MDVSTAWWIGAGILLALEMTTGTIYLLMLALGMAAAALSAHAGWSLSGQITVASVVGLVAVLGWHLLRLRQRGARPARAERSVNLDIGEELQIDAWSPGGAGQRALPGRAVDGGIACRPVGRAGSLPRGGVVRQPPDRRKNMTRPHGGTSTQRGSPWKSQSWCWWWR